MRAIAKGWGPKRASVMAAKASCDVIGVGKNHGAQVEAIEALIRAAESGEVSFAEMEAADGRVRRLKETFLADYRGPDPRGARGAAGAAEPRAVAEEIAARSGIPA